MSLVKCICFRERFSSSFLDLRAFSREIGNRADFVHVTDFLKCSRISSSKIADKTTWRVLLYPPFYGHTHTMHGTICFGNFFFSPSIGRTLNTNEVGRMYKMHSRLLLINGKEFYGFYSSLLKDASDWEMRLGMHGALPPRFPKCVVALIEPFVCNFVHLFRLSLCLIKQLLVLS